MSTYYEHIQEIHSSESRYKNVILRNNNLIIPYLNLGVSSHPIHEGSIGMTFIDYSYMVFKEVSYLSVFINRRYSAIGRDKGSEVYYFGGDYLDVDNFVFNDMEICCKEAYLQTLDFTQLSSNMWMPFTTKILTQNMNKDLVDSFLNHDYIPNNIKSLIT